MIGEKVVRIVLVDCWKYIDNACSVMVEELKSGGDVLSFIRAATSYGPCSRKPWKHLHLPTSKPFGVGRLHGVHWCMLASQQDMQTPQALPYAPSNFDALTSADLSVVQGAPVYSLS